jgi:hypothetical protein
MHLASQFRYYCLCFLELSGVGMITEDEEYESERRAAAE